MPSLVPVFIVYSPNENGQDFLDILYKKYNKQIVALFVDVANSFDELH